MKTPQPIECAFYGVGVGPGDPDLITLKAATIIQQADVIAFVTNAQGRSLAKRIATPLLDSAKPDQIQLPVSFVMDKERSKINQAYDHAALSIQEHIANGRSVAFLCEGDPLFFGSFIYLRDRVKQHTPCHIVPGITSINAASAQLATPLTVLTEDMAVISSRSKDEKILSTLQHYATVAILKAGPSMPRLAQLIETAGRSADTQYIEYATHENERVVQDIRTLADSTGPYFSLLLITRPSRDFRCE